MFRAASTPWHIRFDLESKGFLQYKTGLLLVSLPFLVLPIGVLMVRDPLLIIAFALVMLTCLSPVPAAPPVPYRAQVVTESTAYRAGPGMEFYSCGYLRRGETVDVYQQDERGYLAIRPPEQASSWVLASDVELTGQADVGRVLRSDVICWIDSQLPAAADDQWQIRLKAGELVEIIEKRPVPGEPLETASMYYRIVPPAGEFRWILAQSVEAIAGTVAGEEEDSVQLIQYQQQSTRLSTDGWRDRRLGNVARQPIASPNRATVHQTNHAKVTSRPLQPAPAVSLQPLENFKRASVERESSRSASELKRSRSTTEADQRTTFRAVGVDYDGVGWLMPVHAKNRSLPPFALLDDEGRLVQYVRPAPGVNLRRYARKKVGVFGTRSLGRDGQANQLTAYRVIDLARHR